MPRLNNKKLEDRERLIPLVIQHYNGSSSPVYAFPSGHKALHGPVEGTDLMGLTLSISAVIV